MPPTRPLGQPRLRSGARLAALTLLLALAAAACGRDAKSTAGSDATTAVGRLTIATSFAITDLGPLENGFWAPEFGYGALLMKPVGGGKLEPWLLESLTQAGPTTWTLQLRSGLRFQNGRALDAAAVAETMAFSLAENPSVTPLLPGARVAAAGPLTVTLTTAQPTAYVPSLLAHESMFPIFDVAVYRTHKDKPESLVAARIWAGPYTVTRLTPEAMELVPTPGYVGSKPKLDHLTLRFIPDAQARILAVRNGEADLALYPPSSAARELAGRTDAYYLNQPKGTATEGFQFVLNLRSAPLDDLAVRHALRDAIDYEQLSTQVLNGLYDTAIGFYPAFLPYAVRNQTTDAARANRTLDDAGWARGSGGIRGKGGRTLSLSVLTYPQQPDSQVVAVALQDQLRKVGFDVKVRQVDDVTAVVESPDGWNAAVLGNGTLDWTGTDPVAPLIANFTPKGDTNYGGVDDPELSGLINRLVGAFDPATRDALMRQVQKLVVEDKAYSLYLALKRVPVIASPRLRDYRIPPVALLFVDGYQ